MTGSERSNGLDRCLARIAQFQKAVQDASSYIPAYDQKTYSEVPRLLLGPTQMLIVDRESKNCLKSLVRFEHHFSQSPNSLSRSQSRVTIQ